MTKECKNYLLRHIEAGRNEAKKVWKFTDTETDEDCLCYSIIKNFNTLEQLLKLVKTE